MTHCRSHILVAESQDFSPSAAHLLREANDLSLADFDREELIAGAQYADVLWVRLRHRLDAALFDAAPRVKTIVSPTTGLNHIDLAAARQRGIEVLSLRGENEFLRNVRATAEHTIALMLAVMRHQQAAYENALTGQWTRDQFRGHELYEKSVGIIGYGRIGRLVAKYLRAFDVELLVSDPHVTPASVEPDVHLLPLPHLLQRADVVTLHVNLSPNTESFFGRQQFHAMRDGSWFVNTARGELVDENALLETLQSGKLAGAALDVISGEHSSDLSNHALVACARSHPNLLLTPHLGGCTFESTEKTELFLAQKLIQRLAAIHRLRSA